MYENNKSLGLTLHTIKGEKNFKVEIKKKSVKFTFSPFFYKTYYFYKRYDMEQCTTFKSDFLKTSSIWDTLKYVHLFMNIHDSRN